MSTTTTEDSDGGVDAEAVRQARQLLADIGPNFEKYATAFAEQEIVSKQVLIELTEEDLVQLIPNLKIGPKRQILKYMERNSNVRNTKQQNGYLNASGNNNTTTTTTTTTQEASDECNPAERKVGWGPPEPPVPYQHPPHISHFSAYNPPPHTTIDADDCIGHPQQQTNRTQRRTTPSDNCGWNTPPTIPQPAWGGNTPQYYHSAPPSTQPYQGTHHQRFRDLGMFSGLNIGRAGWSQRVELPPEELFEITAPVGIDFDQYELEHKIDTKVYGKNTPLPCTKFTDMQLPPPTQSNVKRSNYKTPTPIQRYAIPAALDGRDLLCSSQTGSGKTAAYMLPMIANILSNDFIPPQHRKVPKQPLALILVPTRELAQQVYDDFRKFSYKTKVTGALLIGGASCSEQAHSLARGVDCVIATAGRLLQFVWESKINLKKVKILVLDEADRLLDLKGRKWVQAVIEEVNPKPPHGNRQTIVFSATLERHIVDIGRTLLHEELYLSVTRIGGEHEWVKQDIRLVPNNEKPHALMNILKNEWPSARVLIFANNNSTVMDMANGLISHKLCKQSEIAPVCGTLPQNVREKGIDDFKRFKVRILVGGEVLSRGLDFPLLDHVILYDMPTDLGSYIHRIGRTGRMGRTGNVIVFFNRQHDGPMENPLVSFLAEHRQPIPAWAQHTLEVRPEDWSINAIPPHIVDDSWEAEFQANRAASLHEDTHSSPHSSDSAGGELHQPHR